MGVSLDGQSPTDPTQSKGILKQIEDGLKNIGGVAENFAEGLNGIIGMIANALFPNQPASKPPITRLNDGMTVLYDRLDLMENVSGYCGAIMSTSPRIRGGSTYYKLPFDTLYGPPKNATFSALDNRITLAKGTWSLSAIISLKEGGGTIWNRGYFRVAKPDGTPHQLRWLDWSTGTAPDSAFFQTVVVCPEPGYFVEFWFTSDTSTRRTVLGGVDRSAVWANRWDLSAANAPTTTGVPEVDLG